MSDKLQEILDKYYKKSLINELISYAKWMFLDKEEKVNVIKKRASRIKFYRPSTTIKLVSQKEEEEEGKNE